MRNVAAEYRVNHSPCSRVISNSSTSSSSRRNEVGACSSIRRARDLLLQGERQKFLAEDWPKIRATIQRLGLEPATLLAESGGREER